MDKIEEICITSMNGHELIKETHVSNPVIMDLSMLADGAYLLELTNSTGTYMERIVKISAN